MERSKFIVIAAIMAALAAAGAVGIAATSLADSGADSEPVYNENVFGAGLPPPAGGFYIIHHAHLAGPGPDEAARRADWVARVAVTKQLEPFWTTSDGKRPNVSEQRLMMNPNYNILTPYELRIKSVLKGDAREGDTIRLNSVGGRIGDDIMALDYDGFAFTPGTEALLFLRDCGQSRANRFDDPAARFRIIDRYQLDENGEPIDASVTYEGLVEIVEREGALDPMRETPC